MLNNATISQPVAFVPITPEQKALFTADTKAYLKGERAGHMGAWLYSEPAYLGDPVNGVRDWARVLQHHKDYYMLRDENQTIRAYARWLNDPDVRTVVDFGTGPADVTLQKVVTLIQNSFKNASLYVGVDHSKEFRESAVQVVEKHCENVRGIDRGGDFFKDSISFPRDGKAMGLFLGGTPFNVEGFPDQIDLNVIRDGIESVLKILGKGSELLVPNDANENWDDIIRSYTHPIHSEFCETLPVRMERDLDIEGNFNSAAWKYVPNPYPEAFNVGHTLIAEEAMDFDLDGENIQIKEGSPLCFNNSVKAPNYITRNLYLDAGAEILRRFPENKNRTVISHLGYN